MAKLKEFRICGTSEIEHKGMLITASVGFELSSESFFTLSDTLREIAKESSITILSVDELEEEEE